MMIMGFVALSHLLEERRQTRDAYYLEVIATATGQRCALQEGEYSGKSQSTDTYPGKWGR